MKTKRKHKNLKQLVASRLATLSAENPLASFLYQLMRDHLPCGLVEGLVQDIEKESKKVQFCNGFLAFYSLQLAERLTDLHAKRQPNVKGRSKARRRSNPA